MDKYSNSFVSIPQDRNQLGYEWAVGAIVYRHYSPLKPGKIIKTELRRLDRYVTQDCHVKFIDGKEEILSSTHLVSLEYLISDYEKKLKGHKARLKRAQEL